MERVQSTVINENDPQQIFNQVLKERLKHNNDQVQRWNEYKKRHEKVIEGLQVLPQELSLNCMVPIGKRALMKGKITHTNEIMVCLGDGYFVKYSAQQAIALCHRRIIKANEMLEHLEKERHLFEMRQMIPDTFDIFGSKSRRDIVEHWDDEKLNDWRGEHRQREKEYRQKLAKLKDVCKEEIQSEDDLLKKLDALELQEELEDELNRLQKDNELDDDQYYDESEVDSESYSSDYSEEATNEVQQKKSSKVNHRLHILNSVNTSELNTDSKNTFNSRDFHDNNLINSTNAHTMENELNKSKISDSAQDTAKNNDKIKIKEKKVVFAEPQVKYFSNEDELNTEKRRVSIIEQRLYEYSKGDDESEDESDEDETIRIYFKHSDKEPNVPVSDNDDVYSPRDIYKVIPSPKSILKKTTGDIKYNNTQLSLPNNSASDGDSDGDNEPEPVSAYNTIVKEIKEHELKSNVTATASKQTQQKRLVSKFKLERAGLKKEM